MSIKFSDYLNENIVNITDTNNKQKYAKDVWNILQLSYEHLGGIKGSGFESVENMIEKIPFWKVIKSNNKVVACILYKDKNGRKLVALGSDGTKEGKKAIAKAIIDEVKSKRSWYEISKDLLKFVEKNIKDFYGNYAIAFDNLLGIVDGDAKKIGQFTYSREIGGEPLKKVAGGALNKPIKEDI